MTKTIIKLDNLELELAKEFLTNEDNLKKIQSQIEELKKNVYDFSTAEGIKQAKELKTKANKFVKDLKDFCEPLEADGKKIANARSAITTKLSTGKDAVVEQILFPVYEREDKIKLIKSKLFTPSLNAGANIEKLTEIENLKNYEWLAFKEEAEKLIEQHKQFLLNEKIKFDEDARLAKEAEEKAKLERENQIRLEAENRAKQEAQKAIDEANKRAEQARIDAENKIRAETERLEKQRLEVIKADQVKIENEKKQVELQANNQKHKAKIHNEILEDLKNIGITFDDGTVSDEVVGYDLAIEIIKAIAKNKIRNLFIKY
jgi:hypothetical protein